MKKGTGNDTSPLGMEKNTYTGLKLDLKRKRRKKEISRVGAA